jgi:hypothetical protein
MQLDTDFGTVKKTTINGHSGRKREGNVDLEKEEYPVK